VAALALPHEKTDESLRNDLLKSSRPRPSVAVVSLLSYGATRTFFNLQTSWFSLVIVMDFTNLSFHGFDTLLFLVVFACFSLLKGGVEQESSYVLL
jgi:hypothetical protein